MLEGKNNWKAWLYLLPALILLGIFSFYPIVKSFIIAFIRDYSPVASTFQENLEWNKELGLSFFTIDNFKTVVLNAHFKDAIVNTLLIAFVSVPISVVISLVISVLLVSITKIRGFFQTLFFLPYVTSAMAISMAFTVLFANSGSIITGFSSGPVNTVVKSIGLEGALMDSFDKQEWRRNGKNSWYASICWLQDAKEPGDSFEAYIEADFETNVDHDRLAAKYQAYRNSKNSEAEIEYHNEREYYMSLLNEDAYSNWRHHFRTLGRLDWVGSGATWNTCITIVLLYSIWSGLAFKILVFTGGLTSIDKQYYDAAKIDATSKWRTFWRITVPMMSPLIVYILITSLIGSFKVYTSIVGLFGDKLGPAGQDGLMTTFVGLVYQYMGEGNELIHIAAAAAVILFLIVLVVTAITNRITKKRVHY